MVGVPDYSEGAMENWGLITFREDMLLPIFGGSFDPDRTDGTKEVNTTKQNPPAKSELTAMMK
ncbi:hypothetical protein ANCDUO_07693 [Ancylostoma duodenale]|uniref:Peptidase M1 membrane alanine aminopeptidase domain-containing protein n=1 Tax=Ancylostoma duodenale TaxID=51022 RepID=A0A0C2CYB6_9BILA|nr:hypothetical protein ANCDUO_07693 [Ancylostoma duodenale]